MTKTVNLHVRLMQIVLEQVPCHMTCPSVFTYHTSLSKYMYSLHALSWALPQQPFFTHLIFPFFSRPTFQKLRKQITTVTLASLFIVYGRVHRTGKLTWGQVRINGNKMRGRCSGATKWRLLETVNASRRWGIEAGISRSTVAGWTVRWVVIATCRCLQYIPHYWVLWSSVLFPYMYKKSLYAICIIFLLAIVNSLCLGIKITYKYGYKMIKVLHYTNKRSK